MTTKNSDSRIQFLAGGGEMGRLTREKDWSLTPLGAPESWPQSLRTTLSIILNSKFPMFLFWGPDQMGFYNDAYRPSLGNEGKHPSILGMKGAEAWPEIWEFIKPLIDQVLAGGEATWHEDQLLPIYRNGKMEDVYWTFSYSPVNDESGKPAGVFVTCTETTDKVNTLRKIEDSKSELEFAIDAANLGTWDYNPVTGKFSSNKRLRKWFGLADNEQIELTHAVNAIVERDRQRVNDDIQKALEFSSGGHYDIEYTIVNAITRKETIVHAKGKAWFNEDGKAYRFNGTLEDITSRAEAARRIQENEKRFRLLADSMPQQAWTADPEGNLNYYNQSVYDYSGLTREQIDEHGWLQIVHPDDREQNIQEWTAAVTSGKDFLFEHRFRRHDGEYRWQLSRAVPQRDESGKIQIWVGTSTDIQDRKTMTDELEMLVNERTKELLETNESLRKSEERYHLMVEEVQDYAILYLNRDGIVENWNEGAEKIKGYTAAEIIGKSFFQFYTAEDKKNNLPQYLLAQAIISGRAVQEGWRVRKDGSHFWASVVITAVHNEQNDVIGFSKVTHDLTEKKQNEDKLKATAAELQRKNIDLEKINKELQSFAYISSHDLQEPLRKIQTFVSRLMEKEDEHLSDNARDMFERIRASALRMQTLINDLLAYSRTSTVDRKYEKTDLNKIVEQVKADLQEELEQKHATITVTGLDEVNIIPFQFRQLLHNLFGNALKFARPGHPPHIEVKGEVATGEALNIKGLSDTTTYCHLTISDHGIGFEQQYSHKIFDVFQRLHGKEVYAGTGIGLAIVKKIVENHNGTIRATGELNKGATFDIYLPVD